jgi:hypothetical protein
MLLQLGLSEIMAKWEFVRMLGPDARDVPCNLLNASLATLMANLLLLEKDGTQPTSKSKEVLNLVRVR